MSALVKYEAARLALAEALAVDEVQKIRNQAEAMRVYARQAEDKSLEVDAAEIRLRAERRLGELIAAQKREHGLATGTRGQLAGKNADGLAVVTHDRQKSDGASAVVNDDHRPTLAEAGISKDLSSRAQKIAAVPDHEFEAAVDDWRADVSAAGAKVRTRLEKAGSKRQKAPPEPNPADPSEVESLREQLAEALDEVESLREELAEALDNAQEMAVQLQALSLATDPEHAKKFLEQQQYIRTLERQRDDYQNQAGQLKREVRSLQRKLGIRA